MIFLSRLGNYTKFTVLLYLVTYMSRLDFEVERLKARFYIKGTQTIMVQKGEGVGIEGSPSSFSS